VEEELDQAKGWGAKWAREAEDKWVEECTRVAESRVH